MKKLSLSSLLSKNNNSRSERKSRVAHPQTRALRVESLEARELLSVAPITGLATFDDALVARKTYVAAPVPDLSAATLDNSGGQTVAPDWSQTLVVSDAVLGATNTPTPLATPVLSVAGATGTTATVSWKAVANAERYSLSYKPAGETTWTNKNVGTNTSYTVSGLSPNTNYEFRLKAVGDGVNYKSVYSSVVAAQTNATPFDAIYVHSRAGMLRLNNCVVTNNTGVYGGAIRYEAGGGLFINNCVITNNSGTYGGAIRHDGGTLSLTNCTLANNVADWGGAVDHETGTVTFESCTIADNEARRGGGVYFYGGATFSNCVVTNNVATDYGGGVYLDKAKKTGALKSYNTIITGNFAASDGDDLYCTDPAYARGYNTLSSFTNWKMGENNLIYDASKPLFTNAAAGDYTLAANSQAINKGNNQNAKKKVDLAGPPRISDGTVDIGAYEYQTASSAVLDSGAEFFDELAEEDYDLLARARKVLSE